MNMDSESYIPHSRLFILGGKDLSKEDWEEAFCEFGTIKDIWIVQDRRTGENKGVTYITFSKVSEAMNAREKMTGQKVGGSSKPLKIMIASEKKDGCMRESGEDEQYQRIFIKVSKDTKQSELEEEFSQWGEIDSVTILTNRDTGESKGLAYVRYFRSFHAALALENCRSSYRPMFATRKPQKSVDKSGRGFEVRPYNDSSAAMGTMGGGPRDFMGNYGGTMETRLEIMTPSQLSQEQLHRLLDLIPGLEFCDLDRRSGIAYVRYATPQCAAYAKDKLSGFEYPLGHRLGVRFPPKSQDYGGPDSYFSPNGASVDGSSRGLTPDMSSIPENLQTLVQSIQQATSVLQAAGLNSQGMRMGGGGGGVGGSAIGSGGLVRVSYCNIMLPEMKPLCSKDNPCAERLFIVSQPEAFPESILRDCLCRFGNLIDCYFMPGKNYGYAKYATKESAQDCMDMLHGQSVCNQRLKVIKADPPRHEESGNTGDYDSRSQKKFKS